MDPATVNTCIGEEDRREKCHTERARCRRVDGYDEVSSEAAVFEGSIVMSCDAEASALAKSLHAMQDSQGLESTSRFWRLGQTPAVVML